MGPAALPCLALAFGALVGGCGGDEQALGSDPATMQTVSFRADAGAEGEKLLDLGGLVLRGYCARQAEQIHLAATAATETDNAVLGSRFSQSRDAYAFVLDDFDSSFGEYDLLGKASDEAVGTLNYMASDGSQVVVDYVAAQDTALGDCAFGGVATYAP